MQSRAKIRHVAVFTGNVAKSHVPNMFLRCLSTLVTKIGISLTRGDNRLSCHHLLLTATGLPMPGLDSPGWVIGLWNFMRPVTRCPHTWEMQSVADAWLGLT